MREEEKMQNTMFRMKTDGFHGELFCPETDKYPGKTLILFGGSDGKYELARKLAAIFQGRGLTALALAYVNEDGLPNYSIMCPLTRWKRRQSGCMKWVMSRWGCGAFPRERSWH